MATYPVAGLSAPVELPVPLVQMIVDGGAHPNIRPGLTRNLPGEWVQHETANTNPGADALMHANWLNNGADGSQLSFHFCVDDGAVYQMIPVDEVTWQAADGGGPGNMAGVSCELCVNQGIDTARARHNAESLAGQIGRKLGFGRAQINRHWDFNSADPNRHHCPDQMMGSGYWPTFVANVGTILDGGDPVPAPAPTVAYPEGMDKAIAADLFGVRVVGKTAYRYTEGMPVSSLWLADGRAGRGWPALTSVKAYDTRTYFGFADGRVYWKPNATASVRELRS